jgi:hypothetical protein
MDKGKGFRFGSTRFTWSSVDKIREALQKLKEKANEKDVKKLKDA